MHVVVIGAGLLGVTQAYYLNKHGMEVTVLEQYEGPAKFASYANGGYCQSTVPEIWNAPGIEQILWPAWKASFGNGRKSSPFLLQTKAIPGLVSWGQNFLKHANQEAYIKHTNLNRILSVYTSELLKELDSQEDLNYHAHDEGALFTYRDQDALDAFYGFASKVIDGEGDFERLNQQQLLDLEPSLSGIEEQLVGAVFFPGERTGNSKLFCQQLAHICADKDVSFKYSSKVNQIKTEPEGRLRITMQNGEDVLADKVVISAGAYSPALVKPLGLSLPIIPAKGYSISVPLGDWSTPPKHTIGDMAVHAGANVQGDILRVAGTAEFAGFDNSVSPQRIEYMINLVEQVFPEFARDADYSDIDPWAGLRPLSSDGMPIIGQSAVENLYFNTGHGGLGWTKCCGSSKALADQIAGQPVKVDLKPFSPDRF